MLSSIRELNKKGLPGFINNLEQTESLELGNLRLELFNRKDSIEYELLTLSNALRNNKIKIEEINESGNVPELTCQNLSNELILIFNLINLLQIF